MLGGASKLKDRWQRAVEIQSEAIQRRQESDQASQHAHPVHVTSSCLKGHSLLCFQVENKPA